MRTEFDSNKKSKTTRNFSNLEDNVWWISLLLLQKTIADIIVYDEDDEGGEIEV